MDVLPVSIKITFVIFFIYLCVSLPLVSRSNCASFLVGLWYFLLHECYTSISYVHINSAATRLAQPQKSELFSRRNSLCTSLGSRHCADACVCHAVSRQCAGHCARICRESSTPHFHMRLLKPQRQPSTGCRSWGTFIQKQGFIFQSPAAFSACQILLSLCQAGH